MKQFVFSLQSLFDIKKAVEFQQKIQMKTIEARLVQLDHELDEVNETIENTKLIYAQEIHSGVQANKFLQYSRYFDLLNVSVSMLKDRIAATEKEKLKCIDTQIETRREIKSLEKLYEIESKEYLAQLKQEQDLAIDDVVAYRVATI